ncbi:MAG: hypothetical protein PHU80_05270 [Kiritimatiellae bacterium]|nr:hypothetical protein [Kiritimatiellia bacterium]
MSKPAQCVMKLGVCARRIAGVALLALRAALRTRTVAALLTMLAAGVVVLPLAVKGDGTPEGDLQILLSYTLGFSFAMLCLSTMWSACALFAAEIDSALLQLSAVKPVRTTELWLGKWCALLILDAVLLLVVYGAVYAQVQWRIYRSGWGVLERPACRYVARPVLPPPDVEAREVYAELRKREALPQGMSERAVLSVLEERAVDKYDVINPGGTAVWRFALKRPVGYARLVTVRVKFDTEFSTREHVTGVCRLRSLERPDAFVDVELNDFTLNEIEFAVDTRAFGIGDGDKLRSFELSFHHTGDQKSASGIMLRFRQDVALLTPGGTFEANMLRSAVVHGSVLAALAAFGLTLSACFTFPVAAFAATVLLLLAVVGNSVVQVASADDSRNVFHRVGVWVSRGVHVVTSRAMRAEPLTALTHGERIASRSVEEGLLWNGLALPLIFAAAGAWILRRRELADAS